jgi:hypothetical protein
MGRFMTQTRDARRRTSLQTAHLVILTAVTATVLAGYIVYSVMLVTAYRAEAAYAVDYGSFTGRSFDGEGRPIKGNMRLLMSISSPQHILQQQRAAALHTPQQWAQFWASDAHQGQSARTLFQVNACPLNCENQPGGVA